MNPIFPILVAVVPQPSASKRVEKEVLNNSSLVPGKKQIARPNRDTMRYSFTERMQSKYEFES